MMFGQPHRVVAGFVHDLHTLKRPLVHLAKRYATLRPAEKLEYCEFHLRLVTITYPRGSGHRRSSSCGMGVHVNGRCRLCSLIPQPSRLRLSGQFPYHRSRARLRLRVFVHRCRALFGAGFLATILHALKWDGRRFRRQQTFWLESRHLAQTGTELLHLLILRTPGLHLGQQNHM